MSIRTVAALALLVLTPTLAAAQKPSATATATPDLAAEVAREPFEGAVALRLSPTFAGERAWLRRAAQGQTWLWQAACFECALYVQPGAYELGISGPPARGRRGRRRPPDVSAVGQLSVQDAVRLTVDRDSRAAWRGLGNVLTAIGGGGVWAFLLGALILGALGEVSGEPSIPDDILRPLLAVGGGGVIFVAVGLPLALWNDHYEIRPIAP